MKDNFLKKTRRKLKEWVGRYVRYNYRYLPVGVYPTVQDFAQAPSGEGAFLKEVYGSQLSEFEMSAEFQKVCSDYLVPTPAVVMPAAQVAVVPQARLFTDQLQSNVAVISADNKVVGQASTQYKNGKYSADPTQNKVFDQRFFPKPVKYEGTVLSLLAGYAAMDYFFHWLNDSLPKIKLVKEAGLLEEVNWFLVPSFQHKYQRETLQTLGIRPEQVIDASKHSHIQADRIITTSTPRVGAHIPTWVYDFYRHDFLENYSSGTRYSPLVYISRRDAKFRNVTNEEELLKLATEYGFESYELSRMPFAEQAKLFSSAKVVLSPHGAGLANLMFCPEGTHVIEFFAGGYVKPTYYNLARKIGLVYHFLVFGSRAAASNTTQGVPLNIDADLAQVKQVLDQVGGKEHDRFRKDVTL